MWHHYDRWTLHMNASWWLFQKFPMKSGRSLQLLIGQSKEVLKAPHKSVNNTFRYGKVVSVTASLFHIIFLHIKVVYNKPLTKWFVSLVRGFNIWPSCVQKNIKHNQSINKSISCCCIKWIIWPFWKWQKKSCKKSWFNMLYNYIDVVGLYCILYSGGTAPVDWLSVQWSHPIGSLDYIMCCTVTGSDLLQRCMVMS